MNNPTKNLWRVKVRFTKATFWQHATCCIALWARCDSTSSVGCNALSSCLPTGLIFDEPVELFLQQATGINGICSILQATQTSRCRMLHVAIAHVALLLRGKKAPCYSLPALPLWNRMWLLLSIDNFSYIY